MTFTLPHLEAATGMIGIFIFFTCISTLSVVLLYLFVPETKGLDLEKAYLQVNVSCMSTFSRCGCLKNGQAGEDGEYEDDLDNDDVSRIEWNQREDQPLLPKI